MGLKSWWHGHGWDGTRETPAEQHTRAMQEQVQAWKARYAAPRQENALSPRGAEVERLAAIVRQFQELAAQMQTRATVVREYHERGDTSWQQWDATRDREAGREPHNRSQGWKR